VALRARGGGLIFLLSTFVTSAFWLLYVLSFAFIRLLHHLLPAVNAVYYQIGRSQRPALTASAFFNGLLVLGYLLWTVGAWLSG